MIAFDRQLKHTLSRTFLFVVVALLLGMAVLVGALGFYLRGTLRSQIISRDVTLIEGVVALRQDDASGIEELDLIDSALAASELRGVVGLLIVDAEGEYVVSAPEDFAPESIAAPDRQRALEDSAFARFYEDLPLGVLFKDAQPGAAHFPFVEMTVPLRRAKGKVSLCAQLWMDGNPIAGEFAALDRQLLMQGAIAWGAGAFAVLGVSLLALRSLRRSERALFAYTEELARMNKKLERAARSAAVGSISAHLMHGLKSPLAGLRAYLRAHGDGEALEATQRMQQLVQETLRVLRQDSNEGGRALTIQQIWDEVCEKHQAGSKARPPQLRATPLPRVELPRRHANLVRLVLENLVINALDAATAKPAVVELSAQSGAGSLRLYLRDESGGIPDSVRARLFTAGVSSKASTGLGLAISRQLMESLQGNLELHESSALGSCFLVTLPVESMKNRPLERSIL